jgi:hypothetical protein
MNVTGTGAVPRDEAEEKADELSRVLDYASKGT